MKEYSIEIVNRSGTSYRVGSYKTYVECLMALEQMVAVEKEKKRPYYVDLEHYDNEYQTYVDGKNYRIIEREVTLWKKINNENETKAYDNQKIYKFLNFYDMNELTKKASIK